VPTCNHFHVRRANSGKITLFRGGAPVSPSHSRRYPSRRETKFCHEILDIKLSYCEKPEVFILPGVGLVLGRDGQMEGQTVRQNYRS